jgi:hypothetical protein
MSVHPFRWLQSWWWSVSHPEWDEPPRDETTPRAFAEFVAKRKHPDACRGGCQCQGGEP